MRNHLHQTIEAGPHDVIEVVLDGAANVMLLDNANYQRYQASQTYDYAGGLATHSPFRIVPPGAGQWHLVVDLGGYPGRVKAAVRVLQGQG